MIKKGSESGLGSGLILGQAQRLDQRRVMSAGPVVVDRGTRCGEMLRPGEQVDAAQKGTGL